MHQVNRWWWIITFILLLQIPLQQLHAQKTEVIPLTIHPSPEPVPALKYRLTVDPRQTKSGNAAIHYGKITAEKNYFFSKPNLDQDLSRLASATAEVVRESDLAIGLGMNPALTYNIHQAALCRTCDWQLPIGVEPLFEIRIPEIQESRRFAKLSAVAARYHIATQNYDKAIVSLQDLVAHAKHVSAEPVFTVSYYVAGFLNSMVMDQVEFWVQQPDSPNLYWALSTLPRPLMNDFAVQELGRHSLELSFVALEEIESETRSKEFWNQAIRDLMRLRDNLQQAESINQLKLIQAYPRAKKFLSEHGYSPERIQRMPVAQAILLAAYRQEQILQDRINRWNYLPESEIDAKQKRLDSLVSQGVKDSILPEIFSGSPYSREINTRHIRLRTQRRIAILRTIEAIRLHGKLPESLSEITAVPIPVDPATNQPFGYELRDGVARLTQVFVADLYARETVYEITMAPSTEETK